MIEKWTTPSALTLAIRGDGTAPTLKNLANNNGKLGNAIDPANNIFSMWRLRARFAAAPASGAFVVVYFVTAADGSNYEDGADAVQPARSPDLILPVRAVNTQQVITIRDIVLPARSFKPLFWNTSGQALTNTDDENQLHYSFYNRQGV